MIKNFCKNIIEFKESIFFEKNLRWFISKFKINVYGNDNIIFNRGEIVRLNLGYNIGSELNKERLGIIISPDFLNSKKFKTALILPIKNYNKDKKYNENLFFLLKKDDYDFLEKDSILDFLQIRSVSKKRIVKYVGKFGDFNKIQKFLKEIFL